MRMRILGLLLVVAAGSLVAAEPVWITGTYTVPSETATNAFFAPAPNPCVGKTFRTHPTPITRAIWHVATPSMRDLFVNGTRVTSTALPPWTPYARRVLEETFDVTAFVKAGAANTLKIAIGNGWYNPLPLTMWYRYNLREYLHTGTPAVRAVLALDYSDGTKALIPTDATWQAFEGRVIHNNLYLGVVEDQRRNDYTAVGAARVVSGPKGRICPAGDFPKTVIYAKRTVEKITALTNGAYLVDFGVNAAGTYRAVLRHVKEGQRVAFRSGERLSPEGWLNPMTAVAGQIKKPAKGPLYAVAEPRDTVICPTAGELVFEPRFTFHVFRYLQVEGLSTPPKPTDFVALDWSADVKEAASFVCSDEKINRLHAICRRTFRANLQSVQSDCPGREKFGYTGDISGTAESFACNYDMHAFYRKVVRDILDEAAEDGLITETVPFVGIASNAVIPATPGKKTRAAPIGWATGLPVLLDVIVRYYGDYELLREAYPTLKRYLDILARAYPTHDLPPCLGDWIAAPHHKADAHLTGLAHYYQFVTLTAQFARRLGYAADAHALTTRAQSIAQTWQNKYLGENGRIGRGEQGEQIFGLYLGLVPEKDIPAALKVLTDDLVRTKGTMTTGFFGTQFLLEYLGAHGQADLAGRVLTNPKRPSWYGIMDVGATTLWEELDTPRTTNSYSNCHPMFGSCEQFLMRYVLGIAIPVTGCDSVRICPHNVAGITWAHGHLDTPRGRIQVSWRMENGRMIVEKSIPNTIRVIE